MAESQKRRRGRPRKVFAWVLRLGDDQSKWDAWLKSVGNPKELDWNLFQEESLPAREHDIHGRRIRPTKDTFGESADHESITQPEDSLLSVYQQLADNEKMTLPAHWQRYLEYMDVVAEMLSPIDQGAALKQLALTDARSRYWEQPPDFGSLGAPAEFRKRCAESHVEIDSQCNRREHTIRFILYSLPPDVSEDLDESGGPDGHWDGLVWIPHAPRNGHS